MAIRHMFGGDWAFAIVGAMERAVRQEHPEHLRRWPLLQAFDFEAYAVGGDYFAMILRDKLSGVTCGPGILQPFPHDHAPGLPVTENNVDQWLSYLSRKFGLGGSDAAFVLPIHDCGRSDPAADFDLFTPVEREMWRYQLQQALSHHMLGLRIPAEARSAEHHTANYYLHGPNSRVNINSTDSSTNVVREAHAELFRELLSVIRDSHLEHKSREELEQSVVALETSAGTPRFGKEYASFISLVADHIQVFGPIVCSLFARVGETRDWVNYLSKCQGNMESLAAFD